MPLTTIGEMFKTPWGIVEHCRQEIESSGAGGFDRILNRETDAQFPSTAASARLMDCSESTARRWLREHDAHYIHLKGNTRHFIKDVKKVALARREFKKKSDAEKKVA